MTTKKKFKKDHDFIQGIMQAELSPVTKRVYMERIKYIMTINEQDIYTIITRPKVYIQWIKDTFSALATQKSYISAILALFRHNPGLKEQESKHYQLWFEAFQTIHNHIDERYKKNEPTEKQTEGYVPFASIVETRDTLSKGSYEKLLLSFYTYIPPLRSDLNHVRIYQTSHLPTKTELNYIHLHDDKNATLVLQEYKTASSHQKYEKKLPPELVAEIHASLQQDPRDYLFQDRSGKPYRASSFTKWVNRTLHRLFKKNLTISLIRHSFINSLDFNKLTIAEKEIIAKDMAHTVSTQDRYRLIF